MTDTSSLEGWLMKQNHGLYRSWLKRYFVLQGRELSYYRNETDKEPQNVLDLEHYTISIKKQSRRHCTFVLVAAEHHMQPDYYLQAETKEDLDIWVTHLQQHMSTSSVLDKWLERLDMTCAPSSQQETSSLHAPYQQHQQQYQHQQQQYYPLRSHHSVESIHTYCSLPSLSHHRVSFTNDRRPSSQSTHSNSSTTSNTSHGTSHTSPPQYRPVTPCSTSTTSNNSTTTLSSSSSSSNGSATRSFTSRLFSSRRQPPHPFHKQRSLDFCITSSSSPSTPSLSTTTLMMKNDQGSSSSNDDGLLDQVGMKLLHHHLNDTPASLLEDTATATLTTSIIHPSEYNHDDDPQERLRLRQLQQLDTYSS